MGAAVVGREGPRAQRFPELAGSEETKPVLVPPCKDICTDLGNKLGPINTESGQKHTLLQVMVSSTPGQTLCGPEAEVRVREQRAPALAESRARFGVGCPSPGHGWELKLQRATQDSSPGSEINPKQQAFHTSQEHEPGMTSPLPSHGPFCGPLPVGQGGDPTKPGAAVVSARQTQAPCCCPCLLPAWHVLPMLLLPTLPAGCQPAGVSNKSCAYSQKPVIDLFFSSQQAGVPSVGGTATSLPSSSWKAAISATTKAAPVRVNRSCFITKLYQSENCCIVVVLWGCFFFFFQTAGSNCWD